MMKKFLPLVALSVLVLTGCNSPHTITRLTPSVQPRNADNLYPVEVAFSTRQQSVRMDSIQPYVVVNNQAYPLRRVTLVKNRWEGAVPVPPGQDSVTYNFKFDYFYNAFGKQPQPDSTRSPDYKLKIIN